MNENRRPTVWVVQEPVDSAGKSIRDFTPAERWGRLKFLLNGTDQIRSGDHVATELLDRGLAFWTPGDFLIPAGHPAAIGIAVSLIVVRHGSARLLIWNGRRREYDPLEFNLNLQLKSAAL